VQCDKTLGQKIAAHVGGKSNMWISCSYVKTITWSSVLLMCIAKIQCNAVDMNWVIKPLCYYWNDSRDGWV
jgi:hypothetical protein